MADRRSYKPTHRDRAQAREEETFGPRRIGDPAPGFFAVTLVKGGVEVGAEITYGPTVDPETGEILDRSWHWAARINGAADPNPNPGPSDWTWLVWHSGRRILEPEYRWLIDDRDWARSHAADSPEANPRRPVDLKTLDPKVLLK